MEKRESERSLTFNIDVYARKQQDLKHRFHLVPLASSVEEGLSFDQDEHNGQNTPKRKKRRKREIKNQGVPDVLPIVPVHMVNTPIKYHRNVTKQTHEKKNP